MADDKYLGIVFPFEEDLKGKYLKLTRTDKEKVKSNLTNLLTTMKGERLFRPDFGTNIMQYLFEQMDEQTYLEIRQEIVGTVAKYMKEIEILKVEVKENQEKNFIGLKIFYNISTGIFKDSDTIDLLF